MQFMSFFWLKKCIRYKLKDTIIAVLLVKPINFVSHQQKTHVGAERMMAGKKAVPLKPLI